MNKLIIIQMLIFLIYSCSEVKFDYKYYSNNKVDFTYQKVEHPTGEFELQIPSNWKWKVEEFDEIEEVEIGIDAMSMKDSEGFLDILSVKRIKAISNQDELAIEVDSIKSILKVFPDFIFLSAEDILINDLEATMISYKAKSFDKGSIKVFEIVLPSKLENQFYHLVASVSNSRDFNKKASLMIQSLNTFKEN